MEPVTDEQLAEALMQNGGITTLAARALKMPYSDAERRIKDSSKLQKAVMQGRKIVLEEAEATVFKAVRDGDPRIARWLLERLHPDYSPKKEIDRSEDAGLTQEEIEDRDRAGKALVEFVEENARRGGPPVFGIPLREQREQERKRLEQLQQQQTPPSAPKGSNDPNARRKSP